MEARSGKNKLFTVTWFLVFTFMMGTVTAAATPTPNKRKRMMEKIETIKMWKLMDALNLDTQTALKVFPIIKKMDEKRVLLQQKKRELLRQIRLAISGNQAKETIDELANKLFSLKEKISNVSREEYQKLRSVLNEKQLGKFLLFQQRFRRELIHRWLGERRGPSQRIRRQKKGVRSLPPSDTQ